MEKILIIERIDTEDVIIREFKKIYGEEVEFHRIRLEEVLNGQIQENKLFVTTLQALGKNKQEIMDALELLTRQDNLKLIVGEIPELFMQKPNLSLVISQCYKVLAFADYSTRKINQKKKLAELKGDGEKIEGYGRPNKINMEEFVDVYREVLAGEITNTSAQLKLNLSKRSYYKYKEKYEKEYTNVLH